jgi:mevalonate kinase
MPLATAPGKLVIFGDYAVLEGAPAAATSVGVLARAQVDVIDGRRSVFIDAAGGNAYDFSVDPGEGLTWIGDSPGERGRIPHAVLDTCYELMHLRGPVPTMRISLNTDAFFAGLGDRAEKLGLGSSAAVLVALTGALVDALEIPVETGSLLRVCQAAHRRFQGGKGSGIDVATSVLGGVVGVKKNPQDEFVVADALQWPDGLLLLPVWSGNSASTPELIARFDAYREQNPEAFRHHLRNLGRYAEQANRAWRAVAVAETLSAIAGYDNALRALDYDADIGVNTEDHERIRGLAEGHGAIYKTSGAGGGDFGIVLTDSQDVARLVTEDLTAAGYRVFDEELGVEGLTLVRDH